MTAQDGGESMEEFSYIVLDLEWNQPMPGQETITQPFRFDSEIIEIGALKLNNRFEEVSEFKSFVRPVFYPATWCSSPRYGPRSWKRPPTSRRPMPPSGTGAERIVVFVPGGRMICRC